MNIFGVKKNNKIPCYVLVYRELSIIKRSLECFAAMDNELNIVVIENPSDSTPEIRAYVKKLGADKKISRYYAFNKNISGNAFDAVVTNELDTIRKHPFVIVTDGDLTVDNPHAWLSEARNVLQKHNDVFACGISLSTDNLPTKTFPDAHTWIPKPLNHHADYTEGFTGCHLLLLRGPELASFMAWKQKEDRFFVDGELHDYCYNVLGKKWARTKRASAYHITWDLYLDLDNDYTKFKTVTSFKDRWYHKQFSDFELSEF